MRNRCCKDIKNTIASFINEDRKAHRENNVRHPKRRRNAIQHTSIELARTYLFRERGWTLGEIYEIGTEQFIAGLLLAGFE